MDQIKIGRFIAQCRKNQQLTQAQLAEKLGITDRAVSKWETGKAMPDSSIMLELCRTLEITVNDLLNGEKLSSEDYTKKMEAKLLEVIRQKEAADKQLLRLAMASFVLAAVILAFSWIVNIFSPEENKRWFGAVTAFLGILSMLLTFFTMVLDYRVGYFRCSHCGHTYRPTFLRLSFANGSLRKKRMRCPHCRQKAWQERVSTKES